MEQPSQATPAFQRLQPLVGQWQITGRTLDAAEDNIHGRVTIEWLPDGHLLQMRGEMDFEGGAIRSLEIVCYDPATDTFPAYVYSSLGESGAAYWIDLRDGLMTHWTAGSKYTGTFSADGKVLAGGWRAVGEAENPGNTYDATMIREG